MNVGDMLGFISSVRMAHWNANTISNEHIALGELYDGLDGLMDTFVETSLGKTGGAVEASEFKKYDSGDNVRLIQAGVDIVAAARAQLSTGKDDDLLNILADMDTVLNKAKYLLKAQPGDTPRMSAMLGALRHRAK